MTPSDWRHLPVGVRCIPVLSPTLPPATHTNVWVLGQQSLTVVDPASPYPDEQQRLADGLGPQVERIILTHHHPDHVGGAEDLRSRTGAPIVAHPDTIDRLPFSVDGHIGAEVQVDGQPWQVVHTPGHAVGHICLHHNGTVVAGDMVAGQGTILLDPPEGHLETYLNSLKVLDALAPSVLLPAHGPALPATILGEYLAHRAERTRQIAQILTTTPLDPLTIAGQVYKEIPSHFLPVAARQVLCHLHWLEDQGRATPIGEKWLGADHV